MDAAFEGDPYDTPFYAAVERRFYRELGEYNITAANCDARCPRLAGSFEVPDRTDLRYAFR